MKMTKCSQIAGQEIVNDSKIVNCMNNLNDDIEKDIDLMIWSIKLCSVFRYNNQRFWERETSEHEYALRINGVDQDGIEVPRTESVAEHSWHMADIVMIIAPRFSVLNIGRCLMLATLHDKLEIITGDKNPIGRNGKGTKTHAFNEQKKLLKDQSDIAAIEKYKDKLNYHAQIIQEEIILDSIQLNSIEAKFIKALDRLQPLVYIILKKNGEMQNDHILFTLKYTSTYYKYFPELLPYYTNLIDRLFMTIANKRNITIDKLKSHFNLEQLSLFNV